jgi:hypothetical protein
MKKSDAGTEASCVAVDSAASTCNHAAHEFFVSTTCTVLVAPLTARGQDMDVYLTNAASIQVAFFLAQRDRGLKHRF